MVDLGIPQAADASARVFPSSIMRMDFRWGSSLNELFSGFSLEMPRLKNQ
jgi:hypothetical protein